MLIKNLLRSLSVFVFLIGFNIAQAGSLGSALGNTSQQKQAESSEHNGQQTIKNRQLIAPIKQLQNKQVQHRQLNQENTSQVNRVQHQQRRIIHEQPVFYSPHCERGNTKKCQKARARWERKMLKRNQVIERRQQNHIINQIEVPRFTNKRNLQTPHQHIITNQNRRNVQIEEQPVTNNVQSTIKNNQQTIYQLQEQPTHNQIQSEQSQPQQNNFRN